MPGLRAGQPSALSTLMDRHLNRLHGLAWHMTGDRFQAEDIAQETFLRFWQAAPKWDDAGNATILTWLRRVATRLCIDEKRRMRPVYTDLVPEGEDPAPRADIEIVRSETANRVQDAIIQLPERQRAALVLSYYQHLSQKDGAAVMGLKQKAYESLLSRAKAALKLSLLPEKESLRQ
ncbi:MAG: sigma-70 family RNA polymerase sigma factor [Litorimonas sp.]